MIETVLTFLKQEVNQYLTDKASAGVNTVELTQIVNEAGIYAFDDNKIALSLIQIEEETVFKSQGTTIRMENAFDVHLQPDIKINLYVVFAAKYSTYSESLKQLSNIILYFQSHSFFRNAEFPGLGHIERVSAELYSMSFEQLNQVWAYLGAKYLPSVVYKLRMVVIQAENIDKIVPPVTKVIGNFNSK